MCGDGRIGVISKKFKTETAYEDIINFIEAETQKAREEERENLKQRILKYSTFIDKSVLARILAVLTTKE